MSISGAAGASSPSDIQDLIDRHGEALSKGSKKVPLIRDEIKASLQTAIHSLNGEIKEHELNVKKLGTIESKLQTPEYLNKTSEITALTSQINDADKEIARLQLKKEELLKTKLKLTTQRDREALKYKDALETLNKKISAFESKESLAARSLNLETATTALDLWKSTESTLAQLDDKVNELNPKTVPAMLLVIQDGIYDLEKLHEEALELGLPFLEISIAHELQVQLKVRDALTRLNK